MSGRVKIDRVLDVKGLLCPMPTVMTREALKELKKGQALQVISNDMTMKESIPSLCSENDHELLQVRENDGLLTILIRK